MPPILLFLAVCGMTPAWAQIDSAPKVHAWLAAEQGEIAPATSVTVALVQEIRVGWHTYWRNPGDAGEPTEIRWNLPPGWRAGPIAWPFPKELPVGPLMDYGYEGQPWLLQTIAAPANVATGTHVILKAAATWLVCKEVCIPEDATLVLQLTVSNRPHPPEPAIASAFTAARERLPVLSPWPARFRLDSSLVFALSAPKLANVGVTAAHFFPFAQGQIKGITPQQWKVSQQGLLLRLEPGKNTRGLRALNGVLVLETAGAATQALAVSAVPGSVPDFDSYAQLSLPLAVLFAFLGGIILNLMPCVLPILAMKALAIASKSGRDARDVQLESLAYGLGAILSFVLLGAAVLVLRAGGQAIGWGFQLQEPAVVAGFALLVFAIGLNLSGVFEIPGIAGGDFLARRGGTAGAFFTGVLAVAVAAPCTAPFMAAALGYALTQSAGVALLVFIALGLGFAVPFVSVGFSPFLLRLLPKPGAWMSVLRGLLAFPMYATAVWLIWVLGLETDTSRLVMALVCALALGFWLWMLGTAQHATRPWSKSLGWLAIVLALISVAALLPLLDQGQSAGTRVQATEIPSQPYSEARLASLRAQNRAVFIDATAAWCVTCLVNEKVALDRPAVRGAFAAKRIAFLIADWTNRDPQVTALLQAHGRSGVPLYLYYAPGVPDAVVLPQILTGDTMLHTIGAE